MPDDQVFALAESPNAILWVGTHSGGLGRLDREGHWQRFTKNSGGLPDDVVQTLVQSPDGALWVGTRRDGLGRLDREGHWQRFTETNTNGGLPDDHVKAVVQSSDGAVWVGTDWGLGRFDREGHWQTFTKANTNGGLPNGHVGALAQSPDGALWVGTDGGLCRLDKEGRWKTYTKANTNGDLPSDDVQALVQSSDGALWVGNLGGLARLDKDGHWQTYSKANTNGGLPDDFVQALAQSPDGALWVGTEGGLCRLDKEGRWKTYTKANTNGGLPDDIVKALVQSRDGVLWVGTDWGLGQLDKEGHWQTYTKSNTNGGLPNDYVQALAQSTDGTLWVGTFGGLGHLTRPPRGTDLTVDVASNSDVLTQPVQTFVAIAFDSTYLTPPWMFHYVWRLNDEPDIRTKSPVFKRTFNDGVYKLRVFAIDIYGTWSSPREVNFKLTLPRPNPVADALKMAVIFVASTGILYLALIFPLIPLYSRWSLARIAVNSGLFTKFPFAHKAILNTRWARRSLFRTLVKEALETSDLPPHYIPQSVFNPRDISARPLLSGSEENPMALLSGVHRQLLIARSGTGKSVFLRHLQHTFAKCFLRGDRVPAPVLIDLRHVLKGRTVKELIRDTLRGAHLELPDDYIDFLISKGGFVVLVDSLNELPDPTDAQLFHTFLNQDRDNYILIASQLDLLRRDDLRILTLAELTPEQVADYLKETVGSDVYPKLALEAQILSRNPQDLTLLAEVIKARGPENVPTRRAVLYREILEHDGALQQWVKKGTRAPELQVIYSLAFRMVTEQHVLRDDQLRDWIAEDPNLAQSTVETIVQGVRRSQLFAEETESDLLGREILVTGFRHELIGKFLAARHVLRAIISDQNVKPPVYYIRLSGDRLWLDVFYFVIDEMDSHEALNNFLLEILREGGAARILIAAYAIGTKPKNLFSEEARREYENTKLNEDLAQTPAAELTAV